MPIGPGNAIKICLVGSSTVGKSCIAERLVHDEFLEQTKSTIGSAYSKTDLTVNGETVKLNLWDTAGQERFRALAPLYYRDASAIVLVYDITNEQSFHSLRTVWLPSIRACTKPDVALAVVGNKLDLEETDRVISAELARGYADILEAVFLETSAKTGHNVERIFTELVMKIRASKQTSSHQATKVEEEQTNIIKLPGSTEHNSLTDRGPEPNGHGVTSDGQHAEKHKSTCKCN
ncbi:ras-related protein Rab-22A-like [Patiria miniata]|uniref:Uncharacterized protein n=1 Tax=Patiria miniata TaxID=46514 RepID=A0A914B1P7_PATMI|nr:ras-related protein Rab-22A-like [Patiria miniata]